MHTLLYGILLALFTAVAKASATWWNGDHSTQIEVSAYQRAYQQRLSEQSGLGRASSAHVEESLLKAGYPRNFAWEVSDISCN